MLCEALQRTKESLEEWKEECSRLKESMIQRPPHSRHELDRVKELELTVARLERQLEASDELSASTSARFEQQVSALEASLHLRDEHVARLESELDAVRQELDEAQIRLLMSVRSISTERDASALQSLTFPHLSKALDMEREMQRLQAENAEMRAERRSVAILEERLREAEVRLGLSRQAENRLAKLEAEYAELQTRVTAKSTTSVADETPRLRMEMMGMQEELAGLRGTLSAKTRELQALKADLDESKGIAREAQAKLDAGQQELLEAKQQLQIARLEAQSLREMKQ